jgi:hypothetical protein
MYGVSSAVDKNLIHPAMPSLGALSACDGLHGMACLLHPSIHAGPDSQRTPASPGRMVRRRARRCDSRVGSTGALPSPISSFRFLTYLCSASHLCWLSIGGKNLGSTPPPDSNRLLCAYRRWLWPLSASSPSTSRVFCRCGHPDSFWSST